MTPSMIRCNAGDIVLVRFPFTDQTLSKKRPALILSTSEYQSHHGDVVILALTSRQQQTDELRLERWQQAGLPKTTWCKPLLATVTSDIVERRLGSLAEDDRPRVTAAIKLLIAEEFRP